MEAQVLTRRDRAHGARALVVDDVEANRRILSRLLRAEGIGVVEARSAPEALEALRRSSFDLVILDIELQPGADGMSVLANIRRRRDLDLVPVMLVSGWRVDTPSIERGLLAGADDYVTRPVAAGVLRARILSAVRRRVRVTGVDGEARAAAHTAAEALELLKEASHVQRAALPAVPLRAGRIAVAGVVLPSVGISGDAFDVVVGPGGAVSLVVLDAAGHGPASGLVVSAARQAVRSALEQGATLPEALDALERCLASHGGCAEAAVAIGIVRLPQHGAQAELINAGLPPIVRYTPETGLVVHPSTSLPIGLAPAGTRRVPETAPASGASWLIFTDGLTGGELDAGSATAVARALGAGLGASWLSRADARTLERCVADHLACHPAAGDDATLVAAHVDLGAAV